MSREKREALAFAIRHSRTYRGWSTGRLSQRIGVPAKRIEEFEAGTAVPNQQEWNELRYRFDRSLIGHDQIWRGAVEELAAERTTRSLTMATARTPPDKPLTTPLGDKIAAVTKPAPPAPPVAEPPPSERAPRRRPPPIPPGSNSLESRLEREQFVRSLLMQRPNAPAQGGDGIIELVRKRFGIGIAPDRVQELKREVAQGITSQPLPAVTPAASPVAQTAPIAPPVAAAPQQINEQDISAAVQLVLGAIPNLEEFSIRVDEHGTAEVNYQVKEVRVTTRAGSLTVRR